MEQLKTLEKSAEEFRSTHNLAFAKDEGVESSSEGKKSTGVLV